MNLDGSGFTVLHNFSGPDGGNVAGIIQGVNNVLYGTTLNGGSNEHGTVFKLNPDSSGFASLKVFNASDGDNPFFPVIQATDFALYGTTANGGSHGAGVLFRLNADSTAYTV